MLQIPFGGEEAGQGELESARLVVLPAPMEASVSYGRGTSAGPAAILRASRELELFDEETRRPYWRPGELHTLAPLALPETPEEAVAAITDAARPVVQRGKFLFTLGGEHTVTAGALRAVAERHPRLGVLVIDAHLDLRDHYQGERWSHACVCRRLLEEHDVTLVWCGTRSFSLEEARLVEERGLPVFAAHERDARGSWIAAAIAKLPEQVYLSIDIDGLDPAAVPGTGTPEPGGLTYREVVSLIRELARQRRIVAADLTEVAPIPGQQVSEFTAARLAAKLLGAI